MAELTKNQFRISMICAIIIAFSGGYMDAYTFIFRGRVFANAQTGNMIMLMWYFLTGEMGTAFSYFLPIMAFMTGIALVNIVVHSGSQFIQKYYREIMMGVEAAILIMVAFVPYSMNNLANAMVSLSCGLQVESIRRVGSSNIATTMCIGNLRNTMFNFTEYLYTKDKENLRKTVMYFCINLSFVLGAATEGILHYCCNLSHNMIMISSALIVCAIVIMVCARRKSERAESEKASNDTDDGWIGD